MCLGGRSCIHTPAWHAPPANIACQKFIGRLGDWRVQQAHLELSVLVVGVVGGLAQVHEDARGLLQLHQPLEAHQHAQLRPHSHVWKLPPPATGGHSQST